MGPDTFTSNWKKWGRIHLLRIVGKEMGPDTFTSNCEVSVILVARGGIEPPTRGFSIRKVKHLVFINQWVTGESDAPICSTMHNNAGLIHAKLTHSAHRCAMSSRQQNPDTSRTALLTIQLLRQPDCYRTAGLLRQRVCSTEKINPNHIPDPLFLIW